MKVKHEPLGKLEELIRCIEKQWSYGDALFLTRIRFEFPVLL